MSLGLPPGSYFHAFSLLLSFRSFPYFLIVFGTLDDRAGVCCIGRCEQQKALAFGAGEAEGGCSLRDGIPPVC